VTTGASARSGELWREVEHQARLVPAGVQRHALLFPLGDGEGLQLLAPGADHREEAPQVHHPPAVGVVEGVAGLVEHAVVARRTVDVHDEDPAKTLVAELAREVHEHRAQRGGPHGVRSREREVPADLVVAARADRDLREDEHGPVLLCGGDALREPGGHALAQDPVGPSR
jgi:hypothetical protein